MKDSDRVKVGDKWEIPAGKEKLLERQTMTMTVTNVYGGNVEFMVSGEAVVSPDQPRILPYVIFKPWLISVKARKLRREGKGK